VALQPKRKPGRLLRLISNIDDKREKRWSPRARLLLIVGASLWLWVLIVLLARAIVAMEHF
jgi:hypothetical protein